MVACTIDEISLIDSLVKTSQITSYERNAKIELTFEGQSDSEEMKKAIDFIEAYVDEFSMSWNEKCSANEEMTKAKMAADFDVDMNGLGVKMNYWMDVDFTGDNPQMKYIVELPPPITQPLFTFADLESKKYIALDFAKNEEIEVNMDFNNTMKKSKELQNMVFDFIKTSATNFEPGMIVVNKKGSATTDRGEKVTEYELKLSDATAKQLINSFINDVVLQEDCAEFIKKYMESTLDMIEMNEEDKEEALAELDKSINETFIEQLPTYRENVTQAFEMIKDVKILGDEGVTINYYINKDGYIVGTNASIDIEINLADFAAAVGSPGEGEGTFRFGITCESSLYNINKEVNVEIPELTKDNSLDIFDMIKSTTTGSLFEVPSISNLTGDTNIPEPVLYDGINVFMNGKHIAFDDAKPENLNGRVLVPVRVISEEMGADVTYNSQTKQVIIVKGNKTIELTIGSQEAYVNGDKVLLDVPATAVEGRTMVPLKFVSENMDAYVDWDGESQVVFITY
jgi:hypothetical protein